MTMHSDNQQTLSSHDIDLFILFDAVLERKWFIILLSLLCAMISFIFGASKDQEPHYKATALVHLESHRPMPSLAGMSAFVDTNSTSSAHVEYITSRSLIAEVVDHLDLTTSLRPRLFPIFGARAQHLFQPSFIGDLAKPLFDATNYAWGGELISISNFLVPNNQLDAQFKLVAGPNNTFGLYHADDSMIVSGSVGRSIAVGEYQLRVNQLLARSGTEFYLIKSNRYETISQLQRDIMLTPRGETNSGVIALSYSHPHPNQAELILDTLIDKFISHRVERNSLDVKNSLEFLQSQLPLIQNNLQQSEAHYNEFQKEKSTVDIHYESKSLLSSLVSLNRRARDLEDQHLEMSHKYKSAHPKIQGIVEKPASIAKQIALLEQKAKHLPETKSKLSQLIRKVVVGKDTYMQLLSKTQELEIVRAGSSQNVHIIDPAEASIKPISNKK